MMSVLMGIQGGTRDKKFIPAACAQWGGIRHTGLFTAAIKAAVGGAVCGHPCFPALFLCCAADAGPGSWACPAFSAFRPGKEAGHEDEVQEDAGRAEGQLLL